MNLIIAEKPDIAKAISKVLPEKANWRNGYIEQGTYVLTWCFGHLLTLKDPEDYGTEYSRQNTPNEKLPIFFDNWGIKIDDSLSNLGKEKSGKAEQVKIIGNLLKKTNLVIIAGDIDDEGQLIVEELLHWHQYKGPVKRLDTGALNASSLKKALANLMDNETWHKRALAAHARRIADYALGINGSRFYSNKYKIPLSVGRVQTVALGLVIKRDEAIENHSALRYYLLDMIASTNGVDYSVRFSPAESNSKLVDGKITDKSFLTVVGNLSSGKTMKGTVTKEIVSEAPPLPFNISALKTYCSEKFNISPEETLRITQSLRMNYGGLITYNRSECRYLPENMHAEAKDILDTVISNMGPKWRFKGLDASIKSKAFNDKNIEAHHAIIPTNQRTDISTLPENELKVYKAICGYYTIQFMPHCKREKTTLTLEGKNGNNFVATSLKIIDEGFRKVMPSNSEKINNLSGLNAGEYEFTLSSPVITEKDTTPPPRYTDSSLEEDMKNVAKYVEDENIRKILLQKDADSKSEHGSIGTAATRSAIIKSLKDRGFLINDKKKVISTPLGREFFKILPAELQKPELTARWWLIQEKIKDNPASDKELYADVLAVYDRLSRIDYPDINLDALSSAGKKSAKADNKAVGVCPRCGSPVYESEKTFFCSRYKDGCKFALWKTGSFGVMKILAENKKKLTATMVKQLLNGKKVKVKGLLSKKTGKKYDAFIQMSDDGQTTKLEMGF